MRRAEVWLLAAAGLIALALRALPGLAAAWVEGVSLPALLMLNRLAGLLPFPAAEPLALLLAAGLLRSLRRGRFVRALKTALLLLAGWCLLWLPAGWAEADLLPPAPEPARLEALCARLTDALSESPLVLPDPAAVLADAPGVAGLPGATVKAARYPEWMRAGHAAGVFVPWTGEALVDAAACPALIPYTAVHELTHLSGVAGEGAANIEAYRRCEAAGGAFALSARLWALRYAAGLLMQSDPAAQDRLTARMDPAALALWRAGGGPIEPDAPDGYCALARWLAEEPPISDAPPG